MRADEPAPLPMRHSAADLDFHEHDWVTPACIHRRHDSCELGCTHCNSPCLCPCHRWKLPLHGISVAGT